MKSIAGVQERRASQPQLEQAAVSVRAALSKFKNGFDLTKKVETALEQGDYPAAIAALDDLYVEANMPVSLLGAKVALSNALVAE